MERRGLLLFCKKVAKKLLGEGGLEDMVIQMGLGGNVGLDWI